jgi:hypothetical protein
MLARQVQRRAVGPVLPLQQCKVVSSDTVGKQETCVFGWSRLCPYKPANTCQVLVECGRTREERVRLVLCVGAIPADGIADDE